jgi:hypothetical protein
MVVKSRQLSPTILIITNVLLPVKLVSTFTKIVVAVLIAYLLAPPALMPQPVYLALVATTTLMMVRNSAFSTLPLLTMGAQQPLTSSPTTEYVGLVTILVPLALGALPYVLDAKMDIC